MIEENVYVDLRYIDIDYGGMMQGREITTKISASDWDDLHNQAATLVRQLAKSYEYQHKWNYGKYTLFRNQMGSNKFTSVNLLSPTTV